MDVLETLNVMICTQHNKPIHQNMKVLNNESCCNLILGRDFLAKVTTIEFYFPRLRIKLGANWHTCIQINQPTSVSLVHSATLPPQSESIINIHCSKSISLIAADFEPILFQGDEGIYTTRYRLIPNSEGIFQISLLTINDQPISLHANQQVGCIMGVEDMLTKCNNTSPVISRSLIDNIVYSESLTENDRSQISNVISNCKDVFTQNPKKPTLVTNMQYRIITEDAQPVCRKPY